MRRVLTVLFGLFISVFAYAGDIANPNDYFALECENVKDGGYRTFYTKGGFEYVIIKNKEYVRLNNNLKTVEGVYIDTSVYKDCESIEVGREMYRSGISLEKASADMLALGGKVRSVAEFDALITQRTEATTIQVEEPVEEQPQRNVKQPVAASESQQVTYAEPVPADDWDVDKYIENNGSFYRFDCTHRVSGDEHEFYTLDGYSGKLGYNSGVIFLRGPAGVMGDIDGKAYTKCTRHEVSGNDYLRYSGHVTY